MNPSESLTPKIFAPCYKFYYDKFCPVPDTYVWERKTRSCQQKHHFFFFFSTKMTKTIVFVSIELGSHTNDAKFPWSGDI